MAKNGVLIRHFDRQTLYTRLVDEMIPKETAAEKAKPKPPQSLDEWVAAGKQLIRLIAVGPQTKDEPAQEEDKRA
jgi:diadenylate cyclase